MIQYGKSSIHSSYTEEVFEDAVKISSPSGFGVVGHLAGLPEMRSLYNEMNRCNDGAQIAFVNNGAVARPVVVVQSNQSAFYERIHGPQEFVTKIWRDYYYAVLYTVFDFIDSNWSHEYVWLDHLIHYCACPYGLLECALEALGHLEAEKNIAMNLLLGCHSGRVPDARIEEAVRRVQETPTTHKEVKTRAVSYPHYEQAIENLVVLQVDVPYTDTFAERGG